MSKKVLVTGAGGFIGGHLTKRLLEEGHEVRACDRKPYGEWWQLHPDAENRVDDLKLASQAHAAVRGIEDVYNLAADMGGMGFIESHKADCMLSVLINTHMLEAARDAGVHRYFFSSSACVYRADKQEDVDVTALVEADAYPAMPEDGYGWEKLFGERMCRHFREDYGLETRMARFHNVYGPYGEFEGGREKAPAATCRKVIEALLSGDHQIGIWGDGEQTRSFMYVDDCVEGIRKIMDSEILVPINLGSSELVSINELVDMVEGFAGIGLLRKYDLSAPQGVRGRNSDNTLIQQLLGWEPDTHLVDGMKVLYDSIYEILSKR